MTSRDEDTSAPSGAEEPKGPLAEGDPDENEGREEGAASGNDPRPRGMEEPKGPLAEVDPDEPS